MYAGDDYRYLRPRRRHTALLGERNVVPQASGRRLYQLQGVSSCVPLALDSASVPIERAPRMCTTPSTSFATLAYVAALASLVAGLLFAREPAPPARAC